MKGVIPYLLAALLGAALCWGVLASRHTKAIREYDRLMALASEQTRVSDSLWAASEAQRIETGKRLDSLTRPNPAIGQLIRDRNLAQQEARRALALAGTTSDSLKAVQAALVGAEERESAALEVIAARDRTIAEVRALQLQRMAEDSSRIVDLTKDRDKWKRLAEVAPVTPKGPSRTLVALGTAVVLLLVK